jgi:hypothetical protein
MLSKPTKRQATVAERSQLVRKHLDQAAVQALCRRNPSTEYDACTFFLLYQKMTALFKQTPPPTTHDIAVACDLPPYFGTSLMRRVTGQTNWSSFPLTSDVIVGYNSLRASTNCIGTTLNTSKKRTKLRGYFTLYVIPRIASSLLLTWERLSQVTFSTLFCDLTV